MVSPNYLPTIGGVETHVSQVAPRLIEAGVQVEILTTDRTGDLPERELVQGVPVTRVRAYPKGRDYYLAPGVFRAISAGRWDLIHCQGYHTLVPPIAMLAALHAHTPYVLSFHSGGHSSRLRNEVRGLQAVALRPLLASARRLIAVSEFESDLFHRRLRLARRRFTVVPNGVDRLFFSAGGASSAEAPLIVSVGRLEWYKGHDRAIRALPHLLTVHPGVRLRIAGSGPCEAKLHDLAKSLRVEERVEIRPVPGGDVRAMCDLLGAASVVVLLSQYEAGPVAALEAAATGRPVLVSSTTGLGEIARRGWATSISPRAGAAEVARCVDSLIRRGPRQAPRDLPTWEATTAALLELYENVIDRAVRPA
jgi:glycosyltransferase involved in cell wall biosynthesis